MISWLLTGSIIILICIFLNRLSGKFGIPVLLAFIVLGMIFGSDGLLKIPFENYAFAEKICSVALIFIMFYGGFGTNWKEARSIAPKALVLSSLGVFLTAFFTGLFCRFVLGFPLLQSFLIGSVISSTDAASVFSILRFRQLNLRDHTASTLEVESGSNDPFSYMLTMVVLTLMGQPMRASQVAYMIFAQVAYGLLLGVAIAWAALFVLRRFHFTTDGFSAIFVFAVALLSYSIPAAIGGNGYLGAYVTGILLGNQKFQDKKSLVHFFDGIMGLMQMLIFFLLGLLSSPSQLLEVVAPALLIALFLTFLARPVVVFLLLLPFRCPVNQQLLISWAGLRGASSIVFAIMAITHPHYGHSDVFHMVFCIVLFSISLQGSLIPWVSRRLDMIDDQSNVLKTFTDYSDETPIEFVRLLITEHHPWIGQSVQNLILPPDTLLALLVRKGHSILPRGNTVIEPDDVLVLGAFSFDESTPISLSEHIVGKEDPWNNTRVMDLHLEKDALLILIKRGEETLIPTGSTVLQEKDIVVLSEMMG